MAKSPELGPNDVRQCFGEAVAFYELPRMEKLLRGPLSFTAKSLAGIVLETGVLPPARVRARTFFGDLWIQVPPYGTVWTYGFLPVNPELRLTRFLLTCLRPGDVFFDVGANLGYYTVLASRLVGGRGRVHAFEPELSALGMLRPNAGGLGNVVIVEGAASDSEGSAEFYAPGERDLGLASLDPHAMDEIGGWKRRFEVKAMTLDRYCEESGTRPAVVKIDVECAEAKVLAGARRLLAEPGVTVVVEIWVRPFPEEHRRAVELLEAAGLKAHAIDSEGRLVALPRLGDYVEDIGALRSRLTGGSAQGFDNLAFRAA